MSVLLGKDPAPVSHLLFFYDVTAFTSGIRLPGREARLRHRGQCRMHRDVTGPDVIHPGRSATFRR
jgi:hypothetical protein